MRSELNRTTAPQIVRFFDYCFKQGVYDAYNFADDYAARDFLEQHKAAWDFGVLGEPDDFDWEQWRFTLYRWARRVNGLSRFAVTYIYRILKKNYLWYLLPFCMRFYLMGIEEWLDYPNPVGMEMFKLEPKIHWKPMKKFKKITLTDTISYMQEFTYEYRRVPEEERTMSVETMDNFCMAVHDLTRKYVTGRKIRIQKN